MITGKQVRFIGRGRQEKLRDFNGRVNYIIRELTRSLDIGEKPVAISGKGEITAELIDSGIDVKIISSQRGMIDAVVLTYSTDIPEKEEAVDERKEVVETKPEEVVEKEEGTTDVSKEGAAEEKKKQTTKK